MGLGKSTQTLSFLHSPTEGKWEVVSTQPGFAEFREVLKSRVPPYRQQETGIVGQVYP